MKRCGIFVFYDEHGIVEPYVDFLLKSILEVLDKLIIVINGEVEPREREKLYQYSKNVFQRRNIGYDGGAYKDVFTYFLKNENWDQWDEILLMNDTFYGPFYQWTEIFKLMDGSKCDFWGLSQHPGGPENFFGGEIISPHIQSYFILVKRKMFTHPSFISFWEKMNYPQNFKEAVKKFEIYFSEYFSGIGFKFESWLDVKLKQYKNLTPFDTNDMEILIKDFKFPVLKRKAYMLQNYIGLKRLFIYLEDNNAYLLNVMKKDLYKRCIDGKLSPYNPYELLKFCGKHEEIYLFGMGRYAQNIEQFLMDFGKQVNGYIVSKAVTQRNNVYEINDFSVKPGQGVIVTLNQKNCGEVNRIITEKIPLQHVFFPTYD